eukprot:579123-Alexandrium_andersonii.AAC.1
MSASLVGSEMCIRDRDIQASPKHHIDPAATLGVVGADIVWGGLECTSIGAGSAEGAPFQGLR